MPQRIAPAARERSDAYFSLNNRRLAGERALADQETERQNALRLLRAQPPEEWSEAALPIMATAADVREVVQYLKRKPSGVSIVEAMDDVRRRLFEPRKIAAYEFWGIVERPHGDRLKLSARGRDFAAKLEPETTAYRGVLAGVAPYGDALRWMLTQQRDVVTYADVSAYWRAQHAEALQQCDERTAEAAVVCFFHLCQASELGTMTIGKRGQPARLRIEREELALYLEGRTNASHASSAEVDAATNVLTTTSTDSHAIADDLLTTSAAIAAAASTPPPPFAASERLRLYVSCRAETRVVGQILTALELAGIESRRAPFAATQDSLPVGEDVFRAMHESNAALFVVTGEERAKNDRTDALKTRAADVALDENLLLEIGAAYVLYRRRVLLLWGAPHPLPAHLRSLPHFTFDRDTLTWEQGVEVMKAINELKK